MTTRITAEAVIKGRDETGGAFDSVKAKIDALVKKFGQVGKAAAISGQIEKMNAALKQTQDQLAGVQKLQTAEERLARLSTRSAQQKAIAEEQANARTAAAAQRAAAAYYKQLDAVNALRRNLEGAGVAVNRLASEEARLRGAIDSTSGALARQNRMLAQASEREARRHEMGRYGARHMAAQAAAGYVGAHGVVHAIKETALAGTRYQHEVVGNINAGRTDEEMAEIEGASRRAALRVPTATFAENLKVVNETVGAFGNLHHALDNLEFMQRSAAVLKAAAGDKLHVDSGEMANQLARVFELRGTAGNTPVFQREAGEAIRAMVFSRGNFNPHEFLNFAQQSKGALSNYSERFLTKIVPSIITETGGERAGTAMNALNSLIMGRVRDKKQVEAWLKLGLLDKSMLDKGGKGGVPPSWKAGAVKGTDLYLRDPLAWVEQYYLPALKKAGVNVDDNLDLAKTNNTAARNANANQGLRILSEAQSRARLHKDEENINRSASPEQMYNTNLSRDPTEAWKALTASLDRVAEAASSPAMQTAAGVLNTVAGGLSALADAAKDHPLAAMTGAGAVAAGGLAGSGYLAYSVLSWGPSISANTIALEANTAALMGKSALPGAVPAGNGAAGAAATGTVLSRAWRIGLPMFGIGSLLGDEIYSNPEKYPLLQRDYLPQSVRDMLAKKAGQPADAAPSPSRRLDGGVGPGTLAMLADRDAEDRNYGSSFSLAAAAERRGGYAAAPGGQFSTGLSLPHSEIDLGPRIRSALEGLKATVEQPVPVDVTGKLDPVELKGAADVRVTVQVNGDGKVTDQHASSSGHIRASVSTGPSMPSLIPGHPPNT